MRVELDVPEMVVGYSAGHRTVIPETVPDDDVVEIHPVAICVECSGGVVWHIRVGDCEQGLIDSHSFRPDFEVVKRALDGSQSGDSSVKIGEDLIQERVEIADFHTVEHGLYLKSVQGRGVVAVHVQGALAPDVIGKADVKALVVGIPLA